MSTRHELPTHLGTVNKPFLGLSLQQFFALIGATAGGVIVAGHLPATIPLLARLAAGVLFAGILSVLVLLRPAGKTLLEWGRIVRVYAGQARVTVWHHEGYPGKTAALRNGTVSLHSPASGVSALPGTRHEGRDR